MQSLRECVRECPRRVRGKDDHLSRALGEALKRRR